MDVEKRNVQAARGVGGKVMERVPATASKSAIFCHLTGTDIRRVKMSVTCGCGLAGISQRLK